MPTPFAAPRTALRALRQRVVKSIPLVVFFGCSSTVSFSSSTSVLP